MTRFANHDGHWVAGFTDGEGFFHLQTRRRRLERYPGKFFRGVSFLFGISLRADDYRALRRVQRTLGVGAIDGPYEKKPGNPQYRFTVRKREDIRTVVAFFRQFPLRSKKARDFRLWSRAATLYDRAVKDTKRLVFRRGIQGRRSLVKRRPGINDPLRRFYTIPPSIFRKLDALSRDIKRVRRYKDPVVLREGSHI